MWNRKFKFGSEIYYKFLQDIIPYEIENVRVNYYGENLASGYARGIDLKINGEFVEGIQSYASLSWLQTKEDLSNDFYYDTSTKWRKNYTWIYHRSDQSR